MSDHDESSFNAHNESFDLNPTHSGIVHEKSIKDEGKSRWYDRIHSHHVCGGVWFLVTVAALALVIGFMVPVWEFSPVMTRCTLLSKQNNYAFVGESEMVTFKMYRSEFGVKYQVDGTFRNSTLYGPTSNAWNDPRFAGYTYSYSLRNEFYNSYSIGQEFDCFYSSGAPDRVILEYDSRLNAVITIPVVTFLICLWILIYPPLEKYIRKQYEQHQGVKQYMELSQMEEKYGRGVELEQVAEDYFFDDTVGAYRRIGTGEIVQPAVDGDEVDGDDEFELIEEQIEVIGKFFGKNIEEQGSFILKSEETPEVENNIKIVRGGDKNQDEDDEDGISRAPPQQPQTTHTTLLILDDDDEEEEDSDYED